MDPIIGGALISTAGNLLGGLLGGGQAEKDYNLNKAAFKHGIEVRAEDARKAGIHPLAALGAGWPNYTPVGQGKGDSIGQGVSGAANTLAQLFQALGEKDKTEAETARTLAETDLLRAQVNTVNRTVEGAARGVTTGGAVLSDPSETRNGMTPINYGDPEAINAAPGGDLFVTTRGTRGQPIVQPNMDVASDFETTAMSHAENGTLGPWSRELIKKNDPEAYRRYSGFIDKLQKHPSAFDMAAEHRQRILKYLKAWFKEWTAVRHGGGGW